MLTRILCILLPILLAAAGCSSHPDPATEVTGAPVERSDCTVDEFIELYGAYCEENGIRLVLHRDDMTQQENEIYFQAVDITPAAAWEEVGCRIFKLNWECETFVVYKGELHPIGAGFGGYGVVDIETCNFDLDEQKDLIYTYSWGSGLHRSLIGVFNFSTMEQTQLDYANLNSDMALEKLGDAEFDVYDATVAPERHLDFSHVRLTKAKKLLSVMSRDDQPAIVGAD